MSKPKWTTLTLWAMVVAFAVSKRDWIWEIIKPWPKWWKLLTAMVVAVFMTAVLLWSSGLWMLFGLPY